MGFNVFASGTAHFHYEKDNFIDGDTFTPIKVVSALMFMTPTKLGAVDAYIGYKQPGITDLVESIATLEFLHLLNDSVDYLAMCSGASDGWIMVAGTETHALWADTKSYAKYNFQPGDNPGAEFIKTIAPGLKDTSLNTWGVLAALSIVLSKFSSAIGEDATPMINIFLDH